MHPELDQLAAYLDRALDEPARATVRAHILTCSACAARLERLRADARRITAFSAAAPAPDVRAAVRARLRHGGAGGWLLHGGALAGALAALALFALLIGVSAGGVTVGRAPDRLFVVNKQAGTLLGLDAGSGAILSTVAVGEQPSRVRYDGRANRLYILLEQAVAAVDTRTLTVTARWDAPSRFGTSADLALDARRGRLYVANPLGRSIDVLDTAALTPLGSFQFRSAPNELALAPDGNTLFALDEDGMLWTIATASGEKSGQLLYDSGATWQRGWLAISSDARTLYVLRYGDPATLRRIDVPSGQIGPAVALEAGPPPQDMLLLDDRHLAIARGDASRGGVAIVETDGFRVIANPDAGVDQHHLVAGPDGTIFALNWLHGTVTRYDLSANRRAWHDQLGSAQSSLPHIAPYPYDGAFVPGGWRWPW